MQTMSSRLFVSVAFATVSFVSVAKEPWRDPEVNSINRLPARSVAVPCESAAKSLAIAKGEIKRTESAFLSSLDGVWDFKWKPNVGDEWQKSARLAVPGCWQLQGDFDPALYTNVSYPLAYDGSGDPTLEPPKHYTSYRYRTPVGLYSRKFTVPSAWKGRRIVIHFGGVSSAMYVRVNGKEVGYSEDSRLPAEFDLTPYLVSGENALEVEVFKHCDGSYVEDQDFWRLSGIFRSVWLVAEREDVAKDLVVETKLADDYSSAEAIVRNEKGEVVFAQKFDKPHLWSCEDPYLYYLTIPFKENTWFFPATEYRTIAVGFRKIEIRDSVVYINGKRALFKGVDRHEMEPETGYTVTDKGMAKDVELFHQLNINAVRTCHYPDDPTWYEICDREGFYVVCEANIESHGAGYAPKNSIAREARWRATHVERGTNMVKTFRNHPSIIFWSLGNEAGDGDNFVAEYKAIKALDNTRPVQYEGAQDSDHSDIKCPMYSRPAAVENNVKNNPKKPYIHCEYAHAMGNSTGDIQDYWDLVRKYPSYQGGFIWDWSDQAVWKTDKRGKFLAYGGDFGDKPNDDNFNCNGVVDALRNPHPGAYEIKHAYQSIHVDAYDWKSGEAEIANEFVFSSLDEVEGVAKLFRDGVEVGSVKLDLTNFPAGKGRKVVARAGDADAVTFEFRKGGELIAWDQFTKPYVAKAAPEGGEVIATDAFKVELYRAPTDNDRGWGMGGRCAPWRKASDEGILPEGVEKKFEVRKLANGDKLVDLELKVPAGLPPLPRVGVSFKIPSACRTATWYGLGPMENYSDRATAATLGIYSAGIGLVNGIADATTGEVVFPSDRLNPDNYIEPGEQGHRGGCRQVEFKGGDKVVKVTALDAPFGFNAWPYSRKSLDAARHMYDLKDEGEVTVTIDAVQMGVGGDDSWGARPHDEHMLGEGTYRLRFIVSGL